MSTEDKSARIVLEWTQSIEEMIEAGAPRPERSCILQKWLDLSQEIADDLAVLKVVDGSLEGDLAPGCRNVPRSQQRVVDFWLEAEARTRSLTDEVKWLADTWRAYLGDPEVEMQVPVPVVGLSNVYLRV